MKNIRIMMLISFILPFNLKLRHVTGFPRSNHKCKHYDFENEKHNELDLSLKINFEVTFCDPISQPLTSF